jgi:membrane-bound lytic murein transglycosylase D
MKQLLLVSLTLAAVAGCATTTPAPLPPAPAIAPFESMALDTPSDPTASASAAVDSLAADADALNKLAAATPDARAVPAFDPAGVSWDIDVVRYAAHPRVRYYLDYFQQQARKRMAIFLDRSAVFDSMIRSRFEREGLPGDLGYLALIESGYSSDAVSRANAVGMWQFMRATGRGYQLRVDTWVDERRDPVKATDAAARHLRDLRSRFGSLYLAAAAYNAGAGKVSRSLGKLEWKDDAEGESDDAAFFRLAETDLLAAETQDYVPKLIAAALIAKQPERYGFTPARASTFAYDSIVVNDVTGLDIIARLAGVPVATIRQLNPQYLRLVTPPRTEAVVRLPAGTGAAVAKGYDKLSRAERVRFMTHVVRRKERWATLSKQYHLPVADLRAANPQLGAKVKTGTRVVIPAAAVPAALAIRATGTPLTDREPPRRPAKDKDVRVATRRGASRDVATRHAPTHRVRRGETLTGLARRYRVTVRALAHANTISSSYELKTGMRLRIPS